MGRLQWPTDRIEAGLKPRRWLQLVVLSDPGGRGLAQGRGSESAIDVKAARRFVELQRRTPPIRASAASEKTSNKYLDQGLGGRRPAQAPAPAGAAGSPARRTAAQT